MKVGDAFFVMVMMMVSLAIAEAKTYRIATMDVAPFSYQVSAHFGNGSGDGDGDGDGVIGSYGCNIVDFYLNRIRITLMKDRSAGRVLYVVKPCHGRQHHL